MGRAASTIAKGGISIASSQGGGASGDSPSPGLGHIGGPEAESPSDSASPEGDGTGLDYDWAGIEGVRAHPDGAVNEGKTLQGEKSGGLSQAEEEFDKATKGNGGEIGNGKKRGTGPNGEVIVLNPEATSGTPTIYVDSNKIRYK